MQAIKLTIRNFSLDEIEGHLYTRDEIKIINQIANAYHFPITTKKQLIFLPAAKVCKETLSRNCYDRRSASYDSL